MQASSENLTQPLTAFFAAKTPQVTDVEITDIDLLVAGYWINCTLSQMIKIKKDVGQFPAEMEITEDAFTPVSPFRTEFEAIKADWQ